MADVKAVKAECQGCGGTGLYCGFAEPKGTAVVCVVCSGTGCAIIRYKPVVKRYGKRGVKTVRHSAGTLIVTGVGPIGGSVTYAEFAKGTMPSERDSDRRAAVDATKNK